MRQVRGVQGADEAALVVRGGIMTTRETHLAEMLAALDGTGVTRSITSIPRQNGGIRWTILSGDSDFVCSGGTLYEALCALRREDAIAEAVDGPFEGPAGLRAPLERLTERVATLEADRGSSAQTTASRLDDLDQRLMALRDRLVTVEAEIVPAYDRGKRVGYEMRVAAEFASRVEALEADVATLNGHGGSKAPREGTGEADRPWVWRHGFMDGVKVERERCAKLVHEIGARAGSHACLAAVAAIRDPDRQPKP